MLPDTTAWLTALVALAAVLALILVIAWLARRGGVGLRSPAGRELAVLESIVLDPRRRLHLVRCGGYRALLLTGGPQDVVVGLLSEPAIGEHGCP